MPRFLLKHLADGTLGDVKEAGQYRRNQRIKILRSIFSKWLGYENAGIIHQHVNAAKAIDCRVGDFLGDRRITDIAVHQREV